VCPVFLQDGREPAVARAKLQLVGALSDGRVEPGERLATLLSRCLACGACETICPADVAVTEAVLRARGELVASLRLHRPAGRAEAVMASSTKRALHAEAPADEALSRWSRYLQIIRSRPGRPLAAVLKLLSGRPAGGPAEDADQVTSTGLPGTIGPAEARRKVAYFPGCADLLWPRLWEATFELFRRAGIRAVVPPVSYCCGYPFLEAGDLAVARQLANENIKSFEKLEVQAVITGCSTGARMLGRYVREILGLTGFPVPVLELGEFFSQLFHEGLFPGLNTPVPARIAYLTPCGLRRSADGAMELLHAVPDLEPVLLEDDQGCGESLFFAALHSQQHEQIMERTVQAALEQDCRAVAAHSPLTMFLLDRYLESRGIDLQVVHLAEILTMACKKS
jgi:glycolate oxidase iron-sulfur subunit